MKKFFYADKSGRGITSQMSLDHILANFSDPDEYQNSSYDGELLSEWAEEATEGDEWQNASMKFTCIES